MGLIPEAVVELYVRLCWRCRAPWGVPKQSPWRFPQRVEDVQIQQIYRFWGGCRYKSSQKKNIYIYIRKLCATYIDASCHLLVYWTKQAGMMNEEHHRAHEHGEYHVTWCALFFLGGRCGGGYQNSIRVTFFFVLVEEGQEKKKPIELLVRSLGMTWHQPGCLPRISLFGGTAHCQWMFDDVCCFSQLVLGSNRIIMKHSLFGSTQPYKHTNHVWHHIFLKSQVAFASYFLFFCYPLRIPSTSYGFSPRFLGTFHNVVRCFRTCVTDGRSSACWTSKLDSSALAVW